MRQEANDAFGAELKKNGKFWLPYQTSRQRQWIFGSAANNQRLYGLCCYPYGRGNPTVWRISGVGSKDLVFGWANFRQEIRDKYDDFFSDQEISFLPEELGAVVDWIADNLESGRWVYPEWGDRKWEHEQLPSYFWSKKASDLYNEKRKRA